MTMITTKQLSFADGSTLNCVGAVGQKRYIQGANRNTITFNFDKESYSIDEIYEIFNNPEKTKKIGIYEAETEETFYHNDYTILESVAVTNEVLEEETNENPENSVKIISVIMGQKTYTEKQLESILAGLNK